MNIFSLSLYIYIPIALAVGVSLEGMNKKPSIPVDLNDVESQQQLERYIKRRGGWRKLNSQELTIANQKKESWKNNSLNASPGPLKRSPPLGTVATANTLAPTVKLSDLTPSQIAQLTIPRTFELINAASPAVVHAISHDQWIEISKQMGMSLEEARIQLGLSDAPVSPATQDASPVSQRRKKVISFAPEAKTEDGSSKNLSQPEKAQSTVTPVLPPKESLIDVDPASQLLEELRKEPNLTPGTSHSSSFVDLTGQTPLKNSLPAPDAAEVRKEIVPNTVQVPLEPKKESGWLKDSGKFLRDHKGKLIGASALFCWALYEYLHLPKEEREKCRWYELPLKTGKKMAYRPVQFAVWARSCLRS